MLVKDPDPRGYVEFYTLKWSLLYRCVHDCVYTYTHMHNFNIVLSNSVKIVGFGKAKYSTYVHVHDMLTIQCTYTYYH